MPDNNTPRMNLQQRASAGDRRAFLETSGIGLGAVALASLLPKSLAVAAETETHFPPRAKRVIHLFMAGAPSQLDLFDFKPKLAELEGKPIPPSVIQGQRYAFIQPDAAVLGPRFPFAKHGQAGVELSSMLPHLAKVVDELAFVKSLHTDLFNHAPAQLFVNTGNGIPGRPSLGSWLSYGLGSEADDLPAFVVLKSGGALSGGSAMWSSGFLPSVHQGVPFRGEGDPILHAANPAGIDQQAQRDTLDLVRTLNERQKQRVGDPEIETRIAAYEMAYRMQMRAPELTDFSNETAATMAQYGAEPGNPKHAFANNVLLARRLAERGVRFIQVYHGGWDHHSNVEGGVRQSCQETDQPCAALIADLQSRGMLDDTLIVWGGEFGRTPMVESSAALGRSQGRDHHPQAFTMWLAGGGIKPGVTVGATDELGFHPVERPVHVHDLQATILDCLGVDHRKLTYRVNGLDFRLTGVEEHHPVREVLA